MSTSQENQLEIRVNGHTHRVQATPDTPLLHVLRNELGLTSPRFGCGLGRCGACTVHIDGDSALSCITMVSDAAGVAITTLEGLGTQEQPHPLQQAFVDEQAAQCGYCIPGIIMTSAALLLQNESPNRDEVRAALDGNLCRCGAHVRILRAVERAVGDAE